MDADALAELAAESGATVPDRRTLRALKEEIQVVPDSGIGQYTVFGETGSEYDVDLRHGTGSCPDFQQRDVVCKHLRRAALAQPGVDVGPVRRQFGQTIMGLDDEIERLEALLRRLRSAKRTVGALIDDLDGFAGSSRQTPHPPGRLTASEIEPAVLEALDIDPTSTSVGEPDPNTAGSDPEVTA